MVNGIVVIEHEEEELPEEQEETTNLEFQTKDGGVYAQAPQDEVDEEEVEEVARVQTKEGIISVTSEEENTVQHVTSPESEKKTNDQAKKVKEENDKRAEEAQVTAPPKMVNGTIVAASESYADIEDQLDADLKEEDKKEEEEEVQTTRKVDLSEESQETKSDLDYLLGTPDNKE